MYFTKKVIWLKFFSGEHITKDCCWGLVVVEVGCWVRRIHLQYPFLFLPIKYIIYFISFFYVLLNWYTVSFFKQSLSLFYVYGCFACLYVYTSYVHSADRGQKRASYLLGHCVVCFSEDLGLTPRTTWWLKTIFVCPCDSLQDLLKLTCNCRKEVRGREEGRRKGGCYLKNWLIFFFQVDEEYSQLKPISCRVWGKAKKAGKFKVLIITKFCLQCGME